MAHLQGERTNLSKENAPVSAGRTHRFSRRTRCYCRAPPSPSASALTLAQLRRSRHVTQVQLAETLAISQGNVSRLEARSDVYLSTLRSYVEALGGHLEIAAVFDDDRVAVQIRATE